MGNGEYHALPVEDVLKDLKTSMVGLTEDEAKRRLEKFGPNELVSEKGPSPLKIFAAQFKSILIVILLFATALSAVIGELIDAVVIVAIVIAAITLGFVQEYRAEKSLEALKRMLAPMVTVLRGGEEKNVPSSEVVPGDMLILNAGDKVAADARVAEAVNLQVNEASLTGESMPVFKDPKPVRKGAPLPERKSMVFAGTVVTYGKGKAVVTATGMMSEFGKIAKEVTAVKEEKTPLETRMDEVGKFLGVVCLTVCFAVAGVGVLEEYLFEGSVGLDFFLEIFLFAIALAVAAVPEALPAIVTGALAIGMREMAKRNALIRRMSAVETLGCTTVICSDKTGTLTKGEMTVRKVYVDGKVVNVTGVGYEPKGELVAEGSLDSSQALQLLMEAAVLCNDAKLELKDGKWFVKGDPTEGALVVVAEKAGVSRAATRSRNPRVGELPFSSERKRMTTIHRSPDGETIAFMKGAPEVVVERCSQIQIKDKIIRLTADGKEEILKVNEGMAKGALRVLGLAYKKLPKDARAFTEELVEKDLVFLGLMGMMDPPREEAVEAVEVAKRVGMKPIMITGDHKLTAVAVAKEMGIFKDGDLALTGEELEKLSDEEFERVVEKVTVYARVSPIHKLRIVKAWKKKGQVVAMTGDGVNDAPAVKHADIGIAMGITGTEVTKEASDMVLADDNFATIVKAIERGRWIYDNIKKYLTYLLQCNIVEIIVLATGVFLTLPAYREFVLFLLPAQILYVNLATDGLPALALGVSPPDPDLMRRPPRDPKESIFTRDVKIFLTAMPIIMSPILLFTFMDTYSAWGVARARTDLFLTLVFFELVVALNCRSLTHSVLKVRPHKFLLLAIVWETALLTALVAFPPAREALHVVTPTIADIVVVILLCLLVFLALEALKVITQRKVESKTARSRLVNLPTLS